MCKQEVCEYGHQCADCSHRARRNKPTGLDTSDMRAYKREYNREWNRRKHDKELRREGYRNL